jgi:hypothetical protein
MKKFPFIKKSMRVMMVDRGVGVSGGAARNLPRSIVRRIHPSGALELKGEGGPAGGDQGRGRARETEAGIGELR